MIKAHINPSKLQSQNKWLKIDTKLSDKIRKQLKATDEEIEQIRQILRSRLNAKGETENQTIYISNGKYRVKFVGWGRNTAMFIDEAHDLGSSEIELTF